MRLDLIKKENLVFTTKHGAAKVCTEEWTLLWWGPTISVKQDMGHLY